MHNLKTTGVETTPKSVPFAIVLQSQLKDPGKALSYLYTALAENDSEILDAALQDVISAQRQNIVLSHCLSQITPKIATSIIISSTVNST